MKEIFVEINEIILELQVLEEPDLLEVNEFVHHKE